MITSENWPENWEKVPVWTEIDEEVYDHFFNVLPPLEWCGGYFQCSEPYTHERVLIRVGNTRSEDRWGWRGKYMTFTKKDGKCWFIGIQYKGQYPKEEQG